VLAEITEARVMLSSTIGPGSIGGQQGHQGHSGGSHTSENQGSQNPGGSDGHANHSQSSGGHKSGGGNGGSNGSNGNSNNGGGSNGGGSNSGGSNNGGSNNGGSNGGGSNGQPGQGNNSPPTNAPSLPPATPSPASPPTGTQPAAPTTPTLSPATEPSASPATTSTPGDSATEESTTPVANDASPQIDVPVESSATSAPASAPAGSTPANRDGLIVGEREAADLFALALRINNDQPYDVDPSRADSVFAAATEESGGFINIDADAPAAAETDDDSKTDPESGSQNSAATRQALEELAKREQPGDSRRRLIGSATEGGFIELAVADRSDAARRHPLLDDQTRRDRSSETDASMGRLIAFDSAGSEAWNSVAANYSIADDAASSDGALTDTPQPVAASNIVAVAFGAGVMLTSSHMTRHRWKSLVTRLLLRARQMASRLLSWN